MTTNEYNAEKRKILEQYKQKNTGYILICGTLIMSSIVIAILYLLFSAEQSLLKSFLLFLILLVASIAVAFRAHKNSKQERTESLRYLEERRQEENQKLRKQLDIAAQKYAEDKARTRAAQEALISLAKTAEQEKKKHPTNCPNCGALLGDNVCSYCGTHV